MSLAAPRRRFQRRFPPRENLRSPTLARMGPPLRDPPMRRTALALFVVEPTHLRCGKLDLIQAKSKFRLEARVGGVSAGIAASRITCEFELLDGSPRLSTAGVEFVTVLAKGLKLSGLAPVEAVEGILFKS